MTQSQENAKSINDIKKDFNNLDRTVGKLSQKLEDHETHCVEYRKDMKASIVQLRNFILFGFIGSMALYAIEKLILG